MSKGKSLSEQLADIANPAPSLIDPEDEYNEETKARLDKYDEEHEPTVKHLQKKLKVKTSLRQSNAQLLSTVDKRYAGKKVSRRDLEQYSFSESDISLSAEEDGNEKDIEEFKKQFAKLTSVKTALGKNKRQESHSEEETDYSSSNNDELDEESMQDEEDGKSGEEVGSDEFEEDEDNANLDEEGDGLEEEGEEEEDSYESDDQGLLSEMIEDMGEEKEFSESEQMDLEKKDQEAQKKRLDSDVRKGNSIKNQLSLWDLLLECRIKYHKSINLCNKLPQGPNGFKSFSQIAGENNFVAATQATQNAVKTFLDSCLELQDILLKANPATSGLLGEAGNNNFSDDEEIPSDTDEEMDEKNDLLEDDSDQTRIPKRKKMKLEEYEREIEKRHENYREYCNRSLTHWYEKTRGRVSGTKKSGFGAFDQSITKQIEGILTDKQRLINRTRIKRSSYKVLGLPEKKTTEKKEQEMLQDATPLNNKVANDDDYDVEIFDDDDFYHQLLRELIEKRTSEGGSSQVAVSRQWLEIQKLRAKAKRKVDSKASKGRRLRYHVHPKLVSFMAPYPETSWNDVAKNELFSSLFCS